MTKPYLIIVMGPTASGKSTLAKKVTDLLNLSQKSEKIMIDKLIENHPQYKKKVDEFIAKQRKSGKTNNDIIKMFSEPSNKTINYFNEVYFSVRQDYNCNTGEKLENGKGLSCNEKNDKQLNESFIAGKNIVFETTGEYFPDWLFKLHRKSIKKFNYEIIISWNVVDVCKLLYRNKNRAYKKIKEYLDGSSESLPRVPNIKPKEYKKSLSNIVETFKKSQEIKNELVCYIKKYSKNCKIRILIFDNNNKKSELLYDSLKHDNKVGEKSIKKYNVKKTTKCKRKTINKKLIKNKTRKQKK